MANNKNAKTGTRVIVTRVICILIAGLMMLGVIIAAILSASAVGKVSGCSADCVYNSLKPPSTRSDTVIQIGGEYIVGE